MTCGSFCTSASTSAGTSPSTLDAVRSLYGVPPRVFAAIGEAYQELVTASAEQLDRLDQLVEVFGRDNVAVELWDHGDPLDTARNDVLARLAVQRRVHLVATNNVHYATPARHRLATALAAVRRVRVGPATLPRSRAGSLPTRRARSNRRRA